MLVIVALLVPALVVGALFGLVVRRHPGIDPASPRPAGLVAPTELHWRVRMSRLLNPRDGDRIAPHSGCSCSLPEVWCWACSDSSCARLESAAHRPLSRTVGTTAHDVVCAVMLDFVTSFGSTGVLVVATVGVFVVEMIRRPSRWLPVFLIAVALGQTLMSSQIKNLLHRVRPTVESARAHARAIVPHGHSTGAAACFTASALVLGRGRSRNIQAVLAGGAVFIGRGRRVVSASRCPLAHRRHRWTRPGVPGVVPLCSTRSEGASCVSACRPKPPPAPPHSRTGRRHCALTRFGARREGAFFDTSIGLPRR